MGNTQTSTLVYAAQPKRPFAPWNKHSFKPKKLLLHSKQKKLRPASSPLQMLILRQDWQRVLCRVKLYPKELKQYIKIHLDEQNILKILPLHLVCALDPPLAVVDLFLELYVTASTLPIRPANKQRRRNILHQKYYNAWRLRHRKGTFPVQHIETTYEDAQQSLLDASVFYTAASHQSEEQSDDSSISSNHSVRKNHSVILQLSPSGNVQPMPLCLTEETEETSIFRVHWDLKPLYEHVTESGSLLPLHIACFYSASPQVVKSLVDAYPISALSDVLGMLPIHWISAGWTLPPLLPKPESPIENQQNELYGPLETLRVLRDIVPDSVRVRSGNHSMTPSEYLAECMDDGDYKDECLKIVQEEDSDDDDDSIIFGSDASSVVSNTTKSTFGCVSALVSAHQWEELLAAIEEDPSIASKWIYGMDDDAPDSAVWKRLPLHLACKEGAPVGLVSLLLQSFPEGAMAEDPYDGSTPLHICCRTGACASVIHVLLENCPECAKALNKERQTPLHVAVICGADYSVIEALVEKDPSCVNFTDEHGKRPVDYSTSDLVRELLSAVQEFLQKE